MASAFALVEVGEVARVRDGEDGPDPFTREELAYAESKSDPDRRLAARLAAKKAARALLGGGVALHEIEVARGRYGPPSLRLTGAARARLRDLGAGRALVSLTHERQQAAAVVLLLPEEGD